MIRKQYITIRHLLWVIMGEFFYLYKTDPILQSTDSVWADYHSNL